MQFKEGATVYTADGDKAGEIDRVVLDPVTKEITHVAVRKGFLFTEDKVVPVDLIESTTKDRITLKGIEDLDALPNLVEAHYLRIDAREAGPKVPVGQARPYYWYPPMGVTWWGTVPYTSYPMPRYVLEFTENVPEGTVPLKEGAEVISDDGEHVGDIERVFADPEGERATHLLISQGLFLKERKVVPSSWIARVEEDEVKLGVNADLVQGLPEYQAA
jgi:uncharacterized protein YrrD